MGQYETYAHFWGSPFPSKRHNDSNTVVAKHTVVIRLQFVECLECLGEFLTG